MTTAQSVGGQSDPGRFQRRVRFPLVDHSGPIVAFHPFFQEKVKAGEQLEYFNGVKLKAYQPSSINNIGAGKLDQKVKTN